jgi:hypothetical protein
LRGHYHVGGGRDFVRGDRDARAFPAGRPQIPNARRGAGFEIVSRDDRGVLTLVGTAQEPVVISTWQASLEP